MASSLDTLSKITDFIKAITPYISPVIISAITGYITMNIMYVIPIALLSVLLLTVGPKTYNLFKENEALKVINKSNMLNRKIRQGALWKLLKKNSDIEYPLFKSPGAIDDIRYFEDTSLLPTFVGIESSKLNQSFDKSGQSNIVELLHFLIFLDTNIPQIVETK